MKVSIFLLELNLEDSLRKPSKNTFFSRWAYMDSRWVRSIELGRTCPRPKGYHLSKFEPNRVFLCATGWYSIGQKYLITSWVLCHFRPSGPIVLKFELEIPDGIIFKFWDQIGQKPRARYPNRSISRRIFTMRFKKYPQPRWGPADSNQVYGWKIEVFVLPIP